MTFRHTCDATSTQLDADAATRYTAVRRATRDICAPLAVEDHVVQSMPDVSPPKWHLAHTTWFFETFLLQPFLHGYGSVDPLYAYLFNSYYEAVGSRHPRPARGLLSRPTLDEVLEYRRRVDGAVLDLLGAPPPQQAREVARRLEIGIHHEQQHQELLYTDIKHILWQNPTLPAYLPGTLPANPPAGPLRWVGFDAGLHDMGHAGESYCFDNERPRHRVYLPAFELADRCITNGEYIEFIESGGYRDPKHWLADGWARVQVEAWAAPLYWTERDGAWHEFTLRGVQLLDEHAPVVHVSFYEADAFARWGGARLPTEFEWERAACELPVTGNFATTGALHPQAAPAGSGLRQMFGDVWEHTSSAYLAYPGYAAEEGALGEYNGKWMSGQMVLRGGACVTPAAHLRATYRNFFPPHARWVFQGIRLAKGA
jgi:ergothioneine biosynthesis protein EgtB